MAIFFKAIYRYNTTPIKTPTKFFIKLERAILKFMWNTKKLRIAKNILNNKRNSGGITIPDLKIHYRAIVIKTTCYWYIHKQADKWNRIQDPEMKPHSYDHLILVKGAKTIQWKKKIAFNK